MKKENKVKKEKNKTKTIILKNLIGFIIGVITAFSISVIAATYFPSNQTTYDNSVSGLKSENVQDAIDELYGVCFPPPPATDTITDLLPSNPDELYKDEHGDIRYYGANPNNYVSFNNELWRIIGVIDGKIKIIRNEKLTPVTTDTQNGSSVTIGTSSGFYWNKVQQSGKNYNNWENSTLQNYLNGTYYNGIKEPYKNMISTNETFYLGGPTSSNYQTLTAKGYYDVERSNSVYSGNPTSTTQSIGLMYPSDYGYAAGSSCLSTELYYYDGGCKNSDYLSIGVIEWLQAPIASYSSIATSLYSSGFVYDYINVRDNSLAVRPVLYLTSTTQITGGNGSQSNPFTLE